MQQRNLVVKRISSDAGAKHPEYRYFLKSISINDIKRKAKPNPIVYLCSTIHGGGALVVETKSVTLIELPKLNDGLLRKNLTKYFANYKESTIWRNSLTDMLEWLGESVILPILKNVNKQKRIILIPGGFLGLLPLHSAVISQSKNKVRNAFEECQITYIPNAQSLNYPSRTDYNSCKSILAIDNPNESLLFSTYEVQSAIKHFSSKKHLLHGKAKKETVLNSIKDACVIHFSTHGEAGWIESDQSTLLLGDSHLYLSELRSMRLEETNLVVLSACETGIPGSELPDEVFSFPSAFIQAGVSSVIGTLWAVNEMSTAILISKFYNLWRDETLEISEALRQAQIWLKSSTVKELLKFIHEEWKSFEKIDSQRKANLIIQSLTLQDPEVCLFEHPYYWAGFTLTGA